MGVPRLGQRPHGRTENRLKSTIFWQRGPLVHVFRGLPPAADFPIALTIGNFDGVHRGHRAMLSRLVEAADDLALPSAVLTFDPPPREFFAKSAAPPRLSSVRDKVEHSPLSALRALTWPVSTDGSPRSSPRRSSTRCSSAAWACAGCWWARISASVAPEPATSRPFVVVHGRSAWKRCATVAVDGERASSTAVRAALARAISREPGACSGVRSRSRDGSRMGPS